MVAYLVVLSLHTILLIGIAYWYLRAYRKAAQRSRRSLERILAAERTERLEAQLAFYKKRHDILLRGLTSGEVLIGSFIDEDPELQALCELIERVRAATAPPNTSPPRSAPPTDSPAHSD